MKLYWRQDSSSSNLKIRNSFSRIQSSTEYYLISWRCVLHGGLKILFGQLVRARSLRNNFKSSVDTYR